VFKDYLKVFPDKPTEEEYKRGASLIPSMLDEGFKVWRIPYPREENVVLSSLPKDRT
jgi:hypothetical protein